MNTAPEQNENKAPKQEKPILRELKRLPRKLWKMLSHNLIWKLMAVVLAISLWAGLITQDPTLTRERVFSDVPITIMGNDSLRRSGMIVTSDTTAATQGVSMRVEVPQREYNTITVQNYNPRLDFSKITEVGEQMLKISTTSTTTFGTVTEVTPDSVPIVVDSYVTNYRVPVTIKQVGAYPTGFYGSSPSLDPSSVSVSGPEGIVSRIARVVVDFDVSLLPAQAGLVRTAIAPRYEDMDGNPLDASLVEASSAGVLLRTIVVEQQLYPTKSMTLNALSLTTGTPASGYEVKSVTPTPNVIIAAGDETALSALDYLFLAQAVDVTGLDASFVAEVDIRKPDELVYMSAHSVMLMVEIGPSLLVKNFTDVPLTIQGEAETLKADSETKQVTVSVTGPKLKFDTLKASALRAFVSAEGLTAGTYALPVQLEIKDMDANTFTYAITPQNVSVTLEPR